MSRCGALLRRLWRARAPLAPQLSPDQVLELARPWICDAEGRGWDEPVRAEARRCAKTAAIVWTVMTRAGSRGGHVRVQIDDATGRLLERHVLPR